MQYLLSLSAVAIAGTGEMGIVPAGREGAGLPYHFKVNMQPSTSAAELGSRLMHRPGVQGKLF